MNQNRLSLPGQEGRRRRQKRPGGNLLFLPALFPQRNAGGKGWLSSRAQKPASGNRGITAFFGKMNALLPGHGTPVQKGNPLFPEAIKNKPFSERNRFSFQLSCRCSIFFKSRLKKGGILALECQLWMETGYFLIEATKVFC